MNFINYCRKGSLLFWVALTLVWTGFSLVSRAVDGSPPLSLHLRRLQETAPASGQFQVVEQTDAWPPLQTAAVICDMWDAHWCRGATARVAEMAPRMNQLIADLRRRGVLIVHCPSDTMAYYQGQPGRVPAQSAPKIDIQPLLQRWSSLHPKPEPPLPIDDSDGGCDDDPPCRTGKAWSRQIPAIEIKDGDAITDKVEAYFLMRQRGITNVLIMGVHENMCILGRPFSIRQMVKLGQNVALVRDLTDTMYNSRRKPFVNHFIGNDLVAWHIEKYWCPTVTSDQLLGGQPFRFAADNQPPRSYPTESKQP
jgi:nicotinamidase-related amidase